MSEVFEPVEHIAVWVDGGIGCGNAHFAFRERGFCFLSPGNIAEGASFRKGPRAPVPQGSLSSASNILAWIRLLEPSAGRLWQSLYPSVPRRYSRSP
jgi:hypothetical protein